MGELNDKLMRKIKILNETIWDGRADKVQIEEWLENFNKDVFGYERRETHALYILSNFLYYGVKQMRELMKLMYLDLYKRPIIEQIREKNDNTTDMKTINDEFFKVRSGTRFLGMGNPSESGCHLLYYFRQENNLPKNLFIHPHQIFKSDRSVVRAQQRILECQNMRLRNPQIQHYVFVDDFCGTGNQGMAYSKDVVSEIKELDPNISVHYFVMAATKDGINEIRERTKFDDVKCIIELDETFKMFGDDSRYFPEGSSEISKEYSRVMCYQYGRELCPGNEFGYGDCQLLIGFSHNTPDNTLPIIWFDEPGPTFWKPIFRRYPKNYGQL